MALTPKQARFVEEYLVDLNATQAAIRAGYSARNADVDGPRLLGKAGIQAAIQDRRKTLSDKLDLSQERLLAEYAKVGFSNISDFVEITRDGFRVKPTVVDERGTLRVDTRAIAEISETSTTVRKSGGDADGVVVNRTIKIKLHPKLHALDSICATLGYPQPPPPSQDRLPLMIFVQHNELERTPEGRIVRAVAPPTLEARATEVLPVMDVPTYEGPEVADQALPVMEVPRYGAPARTRRRRTP